MTCACIPQPDIYIPGMATLTRVEPMTELETFFEFRLDNGEPLGHMPGQFLEISLPGLGEAPISISSAPRPETVDLVVRKAGRLTAAMQALSPGDKIGVRGPFGTSFPVTDAMSGKDVLFVCGGIGLVPVRSAIHYVLENRDRYGRVTIVYGSKTPAERLFRGELEQWEARDDVVFLETVDRGDAGWTGRTGVVTMLIPQLELDPANTVAVICGPPIMYKFVITELLVRGVEKEKTYISLERRMKCGVGKCGHCQINNLYTCMDGPVFRYSDVADLQEAI